MSERSSAAVMRSSSAMARPEEHRVHTPSWPRVGLAPARTGLRSPPRATLISRPPATVTVATRRSTMPLSRPGQHAHPVAARAQSPHDTSGSPGATTAGPAPAPKAQDLDPRRRPQAGAQRHAQPPAAARGWADRSASGPGHPNRLTVSSGSARISRAQKRIGFHSRRENIRVWSA